MPKNSEQVHKQEDIIQYIPYQKAKTQSVQKVSQVVNSKYIRIYGSSLIRFIKIIKGISSENLLQELTLLLSMSNFL